jgi:hypothetical protein
MRLVLDSITKLVLNEYYLPYGHSWDLTQVPKEKLCDSVECVRKRAIEVLVSPGDLFEVYRQLIYMLSTHNVVTYGLISMPYIVALVRTKLVKEGLPSIAYEYISKIRAERLWKSRSGASGVYSDLIQLNFAYSPVITESIINIRPTTRKRALVATLQSRLLRSELPLIPFQQTTLDPDKASRIVDFCIGLRRRVVEGILKFRPRKVRDIYLYVYSWAEKELEKLGNIVSSVSQLHDYIHDELFLAFYYLRHYNIINFDPLKYEVFWVVE